jgi:hypothetical protein
MLYAIIRSDSASIRLHFKKVISPQPDWAEISPTKSMIAVKGFIFCTRLGKTMRSEMKVSIRVKEEDAM